MWYEHSYRRNLVDMHIDDSDPVYMSQYDPKKYVDNLVAAKVDTAILYAGNCLGICFWPTPFGLMHKNLAGRDILGETIQECRRQKLKVNVYFNIWSRWAYDTHPEWRYRDAKGRGMLVESDGQRFGMCCPNTGYADYVYRQVDDLASHYDMDGFWVDMIGWFGGVCCCEACKARYEKESGRPFPEKINWQDEGWRDFQSYREAWHAEFARKIRETVLARQPGSSVVFQSASWAEGWRIGLSEELYRQSDYLAGDFYGDPVEQSFVCKYLESLTSHKPVEFMSSRCPTLYEHTTTKQKELLEAQAYSAIANNASFVFIDAMDPVGTTNPAPYRTMGGIFAATSAYEPYLGPQLTRQADVAIYTDIHSLASLEDNGKAVGEATAPIPVKALLQIAGTLMHHHIPYDVATLKDLERLNDYQVLILPDAFMLSSVEAEAIRRFVENGGSLYASKNASLIMGQGNFLLSDVFGVSYEGETQETETYMAPAPGFDGLDPFTLRHPMTISDTQTVVCPHTDAQVLATVTLPYTPANDAYHYSSAISNPPGRPTQHPALVRHGFGQGVSLYLSGTLERMAYDAHGVIFAGLIKSLLKQPARFTTNAPRPVEITLYDDPTAKRLLLCALNFQRELPNIPVDGIEVSVNLKGKDCLSLMDLPGGAERPCKIEDGFVTFTLDRLTTFAMVAIYYC